MRNSIFKKLTSLIVAMCIVATLIPVAFADTTETEPEVLVYSFIATDYLDEDIIKSTEKYATYIDYTNGNKNMAYYESVISYGESRNGDWNQKFDGTNFSPRFQLEAWGDTYKDYASYKIKGIGLYEYNLVFDYALHSSGAEAAQVYILDPETTAEILAGTKTIVDAINSSEISPVLDVVNMKASAAGNGSASATFIPEASGEHLLVFTRSDVGTTKNVFPQRLTLTPVVYPVEEKTYKFDSATATIANAGVAVSSVNDFGTWGWKYLDIDDVSYGIALNKKAAGKNNPRVMQHHLADLRMALSDGNTSNGTYSVDSIKLALALKRPGASFYKVSVKSGGIGDVYFYLSKFVSDTTPVESHMDDAIAFEKISWNTGTNNKTTLDLDKIVYSNGVDDFVFGIDTRVTRYLESVTLTPVEASIKLNVDDKISVGDTATASVIGSWTENSGEKTQPVLNSFVTYDSTNKAVATVDKNGKITALAEGDTTITATVDGVEYKSQDISVVKPTVLPEEEEIEDTKVNFKASAYAGGSVSNDSIQDVTIGSDVTVTATANDGYTFAYWKNSAGVVLSTSATETFKVSTNTGVIAVFDEIPTDDAIPVYFYNGNGIPLKETTVAKNATFADAKDKAEVPAVPTLTGFVFSHWSDKDANVAIEDNDLITALTRAVAIYKDDADTTFTVKNGDNIVATGMKYGDSVTVTSTAANFSCWKLGDNVVSYEKDYTFDVYGNITLTEVTGEAMTKAPVLVLDKVDGNYFLTYDEGDYELIEAGILFGSEGVSIASIDGYKAAAKKGTGQFTAQPHEDATASTVARGYMICKSGDDYKVIYAD